LSCSNLAQITTQFDKLRIPFEVRGLPILGEFPKHARHLGREIDGILNRLDDLLRICKGQPLRKWYDAKMYIARSCPRQDALINSA